MSELRKRLWWPAFTFGGGLVLAIGAEIFGGTHWTIVTAFLLGVGICFGSLIWGAVEWCVRRQYEKDYAKPDPEVVILRNNINRLVEMLSDFGSPEHQRNEVLELSGNIRHSKHHVWLDNKALNTARRDFLHWCSVAQYEREHYGSAYLGDWDRRKETLHYLKDGAERLHAGLTGKPVRDQQEPPQKEAK